MTADRKTQGNPQITFRVTPHVMEELQRRAKASPGRAGGVALYVRNLVHEHLGIPLPPQYGEGDPEETWLCPKCSNLNRMIFASCPSCWTKHPWAVQSEDGGWSIQKPKPSHNLEQLERLHWQHSKDAAYQAFVATGEVPAVILWSKYDEPTDRKLDRVLENVEAVRIEGDCGGRLAALPVPEAREVLARALRPWMFHMVNRKLLKYLEEPLPTVSPLVTVYANEIDCGPTRHDGTPTVARYVGE